MTKVLLVDDDHLVRMYLQQLIDWDAEGYTLVGSVVNGKQALDAVDTLSPDIILTDISMPVMDGVALIRALRQKSCAVRVAVLSCHDEFEYVKEAMRLGADEYVLKNNLDAEGLRSLLAALRQDLEKSRTAQQEQEQLMDLAARGSLSMLRDLVHRLSKEAAPFEMQKALLVQSGIPFSFYQCAAIYIVGDTALVKSCLQYAVAHVASGIAMEEHQLWIWKDLTGISSVREQQEILEQFVKGLPLGKAICAVSGVCTGDGSLTYAMQQAEIAWTYTFYGQSICWYERVPAYHNDLPEAADQVLEMARLSICDIGEFSAVYQNVLTICQNEPRAPEVLRGWVGRLDDLCGQAQALPPSSLESCRQRLPFYTRFLEEKAHQSALQTENPAVAQAVTYIRTHFSEPISLAVVAEKVGLNAAYLSFIFKRDTGVNFSDYLLSCRMEEVKRRLQESTAPIKEIAEAAGFFDYRHFCKLFKREIGQRPADFRKQI